jgi:hypothetical protein
MRGARLVAVAALLGAGTAGATGSSAQTPTMPSTLRYGSGLMDVPVASVLPHLQLTGTLSAFGVQLGRRVRIDESGLPAGWGSGRDDVFADGSVAVGLYDRAEAGISVQSLHGPDAGSDVWGLFGRFRLLEPVGQGVGFAVGGRYLTSPSFGDGQAYAPGRLGFADERLRKRYTGARGLSSNLSLYAVATAYLQGFDGGVLPENDMTFSLGYGGGMFASGGGLDFYSDGAAGGWFVGTSLHVGMGQRSQLTLMAEHNGFDVNVGAHFDWAGVRLGAQYLAANHVWPVEGHESEYMKPKFGVLVSFAACPGQPGFRCRPRALRRVAPDTIFIPPPPPDTVFVEVATAERPEEPGAPLQLCLATGQNIDVSVTELGDTLVGARAVPIRELRPTMVMAGSYAGDAFWYRDGQPVEFEGGIFEPSSDVFPVDCGQILRVGVYSGVPVFSVISAARPLSVVFIPVRPGLWHRYERMPPRGQGDEGRRARRRDDGKPS